MVLAYPMLIDCLHLGIDAGESAIMFESEPAIQFICMVTVPFYVGCLFLFTGHQSKTCGRGLSDQSAFVLARRTAINASHTGFLALAYL